MNDPADEYDRDGGIRPGVTFDSANTVALETIASSLLDINHSLKVMASVAVSARDILRGRNEGGDVIQSPLRAMAEAVVKLVARPAQAAAPASAPAHVAPPTQRPAQQAAPPPANGKKVADDRDLDSQYGDPEVRFDLKKWPKRSFKGERFSRCDPEFLDMYAETLDWMAGESQKKIDAGSTDKNEINGAKYKPVDATRARGWAARIRRNGYVAPPPPPPDTDY